MRIRGFILTYCLRSRSSISLVECAIRVCRKLLDAFSRPGRSRGVRVPADTSLLMQLVTRLPCGILALGPRSCTR